MIKIAHRGNLDGPHPEFENRPDYLIHAIEHGFDVEVDIWWHEGMFYSGHDHPQYLITPDDFNRIKDKAWFHCKNLNALYHFLELQPDLIFFWHQTDDFTIASNGYIWTYPLKPTTPISIIVDLDLSNKEEHIPPAGICTDYPTLIQ